MFVLKAFSIVLVLILMPGCGWRKAAWTEGVVVAERAPRAEELSAYPSDGLKVGVNPPGFCWTPTDGVRTYRLEIRRDVSSSTILSTKPQTSTVYVHERTLKPGNYAWHVVYLDANGSAVGVSKTRRFIVPEEAPALPMPDVGRLRSQLSDVRPRLFLARNRLREIKDAVAAGNIAWWRPFLEAADVAVVEKNYPEPTGCPEMSVDDWRRNYTPAKMGSAHLVRTALAWRITGNAKYLEAARRWMLNLASWDPRGCTRFRLRSWERPRGSMGDMGSDEASMPILDRMSLAWDWIGDKLTPEERAKVLASLSERGEQIFRVLQAQDFLTHPFANHEGRSLAFMGCAGVSLLGDIPNAEKWLDYTLRSYLTSYPAWGGDEGGWAQGMGYWSSYVNYHTTFAEALRQVVDVDLFRRPFYRNTGYFAVYFQPPYATRGAFGDGADRGPGESQQIMVERLADVFDDPVLRWHARSIPAVSQSRSQAQGRMWGMEDVGGVLRAKLAQNSGEAHPPTNLDGSRYQADTGWAAVHTALGDAKDDVWILFKSSRFGSFSHSHADQNTFQLNAYGRPLLIDSGYYPFMGSPHDLLWTRQTWAHNGILVNGRGQPPGTWAAAGSIESFERHGLLTVVRGQAAGAYNLPQPDSATHLWQKTLKEPLPPLAPKVRTFERTVAFLAAKSRPIIVVHDYIQTETPTTFHWLLHALNRMQVDERSGSIRVQDGEARLAIRLFSKHPLAFSQTDRFTVPPEVEQSSDCANRPKDCAAMFPNQWHLSGRTRVPADEMRFLAVMVPYRKSEPEPEIVSLESQDALGFRVAGAEVAAWWGTGVHGRIALGDLSGQGRIMIKFVENAEMSQVISQ